MQTIRWMKHQEDVLKQTETNDRVAYYLDMGLGKTFIGAEKMFRFGNRVNLLICQKSKIEDWFEHFVDFYSDCGYSFLNLTNKLELEYFLEMVNNPQATLKVIGIINYELAWRRKDLKDLVEFTLMLDESSLIQNESAKRSKFVLKMKPKNVILLSGTPTGGKYENLYSQLQLLGWGISKDLYWKQYIETEWVEDDGFFRKEVVGYKNVDRLKAKLAAHGAVFMKTDEAGISLPERTVISIKVPVNKEYVRFMKKRIVTVEGKELAEFQGNQIALLQNIASLVKQKKEIEAQEADLKVKLQEAMEAYGIKKFTSDILNITYIAATTSVSLDSAKLKKKYPEIAAECSKTSNKKAYIKIEVK